MFTFDKIKHFTGENDIVIPAVVEMIETHAALAGFRTVISSSSSSSNNMPLAQSSRHECVTTAERRQETWHSHGTTSNLDVPVPPSAVITIINDMASFHKSSLSTAFDITICANVVFDSMAALENG